MAKLILPCDEAAIRALRVGEGKRFRSFERREGLWGALQNLVVREYKTVRAVDGITFDSLMFDMKATDPFGVLIVGGVTAQVFFHVFQNIGMTIALMPITGLPLPLLSYGGSFMLITMSALGIVQSVYVRRHSY